jgi:hypothetical protein
MSFIADNPEDYAFKAGVEYAYLNSNPDSVRQLKVGITKNVFHKDLIRHQYKEFWEDGFNYYNRRKSDYGETQSYNPYEVEPGMSGYFKSFYKNNSFAKGHKSKRRGQKKRRTQNKKSRK